MAQFKQNNTSERVTYKPLSENGFAIDLTGATAEFIMIQKEQTYINATATVDEANSQLVYEFTAQDTLYSGTYTGEFRVTFADGTIKHYPEKSYLRVQIDKVLDPTESTVSEDNIAYRISQFEDFKTKSATDASGKVWGSLQERLNNADAQLAEKATKTEVDQKRDKSVLLTEFDIADSLRQQITGNAPIAQTLGDKIVTPIKTTFFKNGKNLFNKATVTNDYFILETTGALSANTSYAASDYILVDGNTVYTNNKGYRLAFYDSNKVFISGLANTTAEPSTNSRTYTTPANAKYVRTSWLKTQIDNAQVELGSTSTSYESYKEYIEKEKLEKFPTTPDDLPLNAIEPKHTKFIHVGKNQFNKDVRTLDNYVNYTTGALASSTSYDTSEFISVEPNEQYVQNYSTMMAFYDQNKKFISGLGTGTDVTQPRQLTTPSNCYFIRVSIRKSDLNTFQVEKGNSATGYEPYQLQIPNLATESDVDLVKNLINIPSSIYALTTYESDVYFENIMNKSKEKDIDVVCSRGKHFERRFNHLFDVVETRPITVSNYKNGQVIGTKSSNFIVKTPTDITGNFKAIALGDSTTAQDTDGWVKKVKDLMVADSVADIEWVGTRGTAPNNHEGRSGWSTNDYTTLSSKNDAQGNPVSNAFWNPNTSAFDFNYYMTQNGYSGLTHAFIHLGINDIFNIGNDDSMKTEVEAILNRFDTILISANTYDSAIKRCIMLTIPPTDSQDRFGIYYGAGQTQWRYKRNYDYFVNELIKKYDNRTAEGIYLVATNVCYDVTTDINDAVHPNATGYGKMGEQVYKFLKVIG